MCQVMKMPWNGFFVRFSISSTVPHGILIKKLGYYGTEVKSVHLAFCYDVHTIMFHLLFHLVLNNNIINESTVPIYINVITYVH